MRKITSELRKKDRLLLLLCVFGCFLLNFEGGKSNMAKNAPVGDGRRKGMVKGRSQTFNPATKKWVKRNSKTGKFMGVKQDDTPFKGVRKEKKY